MISQHANTPSRCFINVVMCLFSDNIVRGSDAVGSDLDVPVHDVVHDRVDEWEDDECAASVCM